jgi:hypothetical protein
MVRPHEAETTAHGMNGRYVLSYVLVILWAALLDLFTGLERKALAAWTLVATGGAPEADA